MYPEGFTFMLPTASTLSVMIDQLNDGDDQLPRLAVFVVLTSCALIEYSTRSDGFSALQDLA